MQPLLCVVVLRQWRQQHLLGVVACRSVDRVLPSRGASPLADRLLEDQGQLRCRPGGSLMHSTHPWGWLASCVGRAHAAPPAASVSATTQLHTCFLTP